MFKIALIGAVLSAGVVPMCAPSLPPSPAKGVRLFAEPVEPAPPGSAPLAVLNQIRAAAGVGSLMYDPVASHNAVNGARCLAQNGQDGNPHTLNPALSCGPGVDVAAARTGAASSSVMLRPEPISFREALDVLTTSAPFHAMTILRPEKTTAGFGEWDNPATPLARNRYVALVNVGGSNRRKANAPVVAWPGHGWPAPGEFRADSEWPNPLWACGLDRSGPPMWFATPDAPRAPTMRGLVLRDSAGNDTGPICSYDSAGFVADKDVVAMSTGQWAMDRMKAVMVVPTRPLTDGLYILSGTLNDVPFERLLTVASGSAQPATIAIAAPARFTPSAPRRVFDSRELGRVAAGTVRPVHASDGSATAVSATVTTVDAAAAGTLSVFPCADTTARQEVVYASGRAEASPGVFVVDASGTLCVQATSDVDVVVDVTGTMADDGQLGVTPVEPSRLWDSRVTPQRVHGRTAVATGHAPGTTLAVNLTVTDPSAPGFVRLWNCDEDEPATSNLNFVAAETRAGFAAVAVSSAGEVCVAANTPVHVVLDLTARFTPGGPRFVAAQPLTVADTSSSSWFGPRLGFGGGPLRPGEPYRVAVPSPRGPARAVSAVVRVAVNGSTSDGFAVVRPCSGKPPTSTVNVAAGAAASNTAVVALGVRSSLCVDVSTAMAMRIDLVGWILAE